MNPDKDDEGAFRQNDPDIVVATHEVHKFVTNRPPNGSNGKEAEQ